MWDKLWDAVREVLALSQDVKTMSADIKDLKDRLFALSLTVERLETKLEEQQKREQESRENLELRLRLELHREFQKELEKLERKYAKASKTPRTLKPKKSSGRRSLPPASGEGDD